MIFGIGNLLFFSLLQRKQLVGKFFKVTMPRPFALQIATRFIYTQFMMQYKLFTIELDKLKDVNPV